MNDEILTITNGSNPQPPFDERKRVIEKILEKEFPQLTLLSPSRFQSYLKDRGFPIHLNDLEIYDQLGLFHPIIKIRYSYTYHQSLGNCNFVPEPLDPQPSDSAGDEVGIKKVYHNLSFGPKLFRD